MADKVTVMVLKVDLQCPCCYKKIKKILCKFPQIRDRVYNDKANTVTITVVCCDPEKLRDKLCCKGSKVIKSIEIVEPPKPKPPEKPKDPVKPNEPEKPNVVVIQEPKKPEKPKVVTFSEPPKEPEKPKEKPKPPPPPPEKPKEAPKPDPPKAPAPAPAPAHAPSPPPPAPVVPTCHGYPPVVPARTCCGPCSEGYGGGPCYFGYGTAPPPPPPQPCFEGYYGYGYHDRPCHVTRCDYYFSEENPQSCSIM